MKNYLKKNTRMQVSLHSDGTTNLEHFGEIVLKGMFCQYLNAFQKEEKIIIKKNIEHNRLRQKNEKITKMPHFPTLCHIFPKLRF